MLDSDAGVPQCLDEVPASLYPPDLFLNEPYGDEPIGWTDWLGVFCLSCKAEDCKDVVVC